MTAEIAVQQESVPPQITSPTNPKKRKPYKRRKDTGQLRQTRLGSRVVDAVRLRVQHHLPWSAIAKQLGVAQSTLHLQVGKLYDLLDVDKAEAYEMARPHLLSAVEEEILRNLVDEDKLQKASLNNVAYAFTQVHQASRLTKGQTTANVGLVAAIRLANTPGTSASLPSQVLSDENSASAT